MSGRSRRALACALCLAVLLAACSDDDGASSSATTNAAGVTDPGSAPETTEGVPATASSTANVGENRLPPVDVGETADFGGNLFVTVTKVDPVELEAQGPGSTSGSGIDVTVELDNQTGDTVSLIGLAVSATYGEGTPAPPSTDAAGPPFSGQLEAGAQATAHYAFRVPADQISSVVLDIYNSSSPNVVVVGV